MNTHLRQFFSSGQFSPALTPAREKLYIKMRVTDVLVGLLGGIAIVIAAVVSKDGNYLPVYLVVVAVSLLMWVHRIIRGQTYYQLVRKDVKDGKKEAQEILKSMGVVHGKK